MEVVVQGHRPEDDVEHDEHHHVQHLNLLFDLESRQSVLQGHHSVLCWHKDIIVHYADTKTS